MRGLGELLFGALIPETTMAQPAAANGKPDCATGHAPTGYRGRFYSGW